MLTGLLTVILGVSTWGVIVTFLLSEPMDKTKS